MQVFPVVRRRLRFLLFAALGLSALLLCGGYWITGRLAVAERLIARGDLPAARRHLQQYLMLMRQSSRAHLLFAKALINDDSIASPETVREALRHLESISDDSPTAVEARVQQGRLHFLLLTQPGQGERHLRRALELDPACSDAHFLLWQLYDMTGRWHLSAQHFWPVYESTPAQQKGVRLREWYLSEFNPGSATAGVVRLMGLLQDGEAPTVQTERRRLEQFLKSEPDWAAGYAALARWYQRQGNPQRALESAEKAAAIAGITADPFVIATLVSISIELGRFPEAEKFFDLWPDDHAGDHRDDYEFWKYRALMATEVWRDDQVALASYERALACASGRSDWSTRHSMAQCLRRLGERDRAEETDKQSKLIESLMETPVHEKLRRELVRLEDPATARAAVEFYEKLDRSEEANAWRRYAETLETFPETKFMGNNAG